LSAITLLDGGTGRELKRIGAPFRQPEWSALALIEAPRFVSQVHESYIDAGADVLTTNTYAIVPFHLGADRFREQGASLAALAGRLTREAADQANHAHRAGQAQRRVAVAGSLPPACGSYRAELFDAAAARPILRVLIDALARLLPGALGDERSAQQDSFSEGLLDWPHYTRPEVHEGRPVPAVLLSGDHAAIGRWRLKQALGRTWLRRRELMEGTELDAQRAALLQEFLQEREQEGEP